jgi:hypothetical protein
MNMTDEKETIVKVGKKENKRRGEEWKGKKQREAKGGEERAKEQKQEQNIRRPGRRQRTTVISLYYLLL